MPKESTLDLVDRIRSEVLAIARKADHQFGDVVALRLSLTHETDRGCALMAAAYLDERLETLLRAYFVNDSKVIKELFDRSGPISTFSSRIDIAYVLGLISSDLRKEIDLVRRIRNDFAHKHQPLSFDYPAIKSRCLELSISPHIPDAPPRRQFLITLMVVLATLNSRIRKTRHRRKLKEELSKKRLILREAVKKDLAGRVEEEA